MGVLGKYSHRRDLGLQRGETSVRLRVAGYPQYRLLLLTALIIPGRGVPNCEDDNNWCWQVDNVFMSVVDFNNGTPSDTINANSGRPLDEVIVTLADTDGDYRVTFDELRAFGEIYLNKGFNSIDIDGDSTISEEEAISAVTRLNFGVIQDFILELFSISDRDKDEKVSTFDLPTQMRRDFDTDYDGTVSLKELLGHPIIFFPGPVQTVYKILDSDKDEAVSRREATNFIKFLSGIFNVFDVDSDCFVSLDEALISLHKADLEKEFQLALEVLFRPLSALGRYIALTIIQDMDTDGDSRLSLAEILQFSGKFYFSKFISSYRQEQMLRDHDWAKGFLAGMINFERGEEPRNPEEEKRLFNRALANWLSAFQGILSQPSFSQPRDSC